MEQFDIDMNNKVLKKVLEDLYDVIAKERRASTPYKNLFKKSDNMSEFLRDINHEMMNIILNASQVLLDKYHECPNEVYDILKALPLVSDYMEKRVIEEEGLTCCVDKVYYLLSQRMNELLKPEEIEIEKEKKRMEKIDAEIAEIEKGKKMTEVKKTLFLNEKFEEIVEWRDPRDVSYVIYDNEEVELCIPHDTSYPFITAEEIQRLTEIMKIGEKPSINIHLDFYDKLGVSHGTEALEDLEDSIRDLLRSKGFGEFTIEDGYTGNITANGKREEEEEE